MRRIILEKERSLPYPGEINVEVSQKVKQNDTVATLNYVPGRVYKVPAARMLSLPPHKLEQKAVVKAGDHVEAGEVLAINNVLYRPFVCTSPIKGVVGIISKHLGQIYIRDYIPLDNNVKDDVVYDLSEIFPDVKPNMVERKIVVRPGRRISPNQMLAQVSRDRVLVSNIYGKVISIDNNKIVVSAYKINSKLKAYIPGEITEVSGRDYIKVKGEVYQLQGVYGLGGEKQGFLKVIKNTLTEKDISSNDAEKIIFAPNGVELNALKKANKIGVNAVITSHMSFVEVKEYAGIDFVPGITGGETITTSLLLINGFTNQKINSDIVDFICNYDDEWVSMTGTTHIRAGALRPELILPIKDSVVYDYQEFSDEVKVNSIVEIKRTGNLHGKKGIIKKILSQPVLLPSLIKVLVAEVEIENKLYTVPLTNLETVGRLE